jgi:diguanylate cyclase
MTDKMETALAREDDTHTPLSPPPGHRDIYQTAGKAFELIDRFRTPPTPQAYSLWYAYVSGADPLLVARVDELIAGKGELSMYDIETIHWELLGNSTGESTTYTIGDAIEKEIESVLQIIQQGVSNSDQYQASLTETGNQIPISASGADIAGLVARLVDENKRMVETTQELSQGLNESQKQLETLHQELEEVQNLSLRDPLTGLHNRRSFDKKLDEEIELALKSGEKLCLAVADIDLFKKVNDTHGHQVGDAVLKMFSSLMVKNIKGRDMAARIGGEEFAIILPNTQIISAYNLLVKIKSELKASELDVGNGKQLSCVTASFGVARFEAGMTARGLIEKADKYMYEAKNSGRDKVKAQGM